MDAVLARNPGHIRAKVARGWIDYIVDTRMPLGTGWILGGGSKKRALNIIGEAAETPADFFTSAEAQFALWELQVREKNMAGALVTARRLAGDFPNNAELARFIAANDLTAKP